MKVANSQFPTKDKPANHPIESKKRRIRGEIGLWAENKVVTVATARQAKTIHPHWCAAHEAWKSACARNMKLLVRPHPGQTEPTNFRHKQTSGSEYPNSVTAPCRSTSNANRSPTALARGTTITNNR